MMIRPLPLAFSFLLLISSMTGCEWHKSQTDNADQNETALISQQFSDCQIDSAFIQKELDRDSALQPYSNEILGFYRRRNYYAAWFDGDSLTQSANDLLATIESYESDFDDRSVTSGLNIGAIVLSGSPDTRCLLDLKFTAAFFLYADRAYGGTSADPKDLEWYIPREKKDYSRLIDTLVSSRSSYSYYEPVNTFYKSLKKVLIHYRRIEKNGGLPRVEARALPIRKGDSCSAVIQLKKSLTITGDYSSMDTSKLYTPRLKSAVVNYQERMGLNPTGALDSLTLAEINTPIGERIRQIMYNMERLRWMPDTMPARYILVNIPEYRLHVVEKNKDTLSMDVVVGKAASATSIFTGKLSLVSFAPYWKVPVSIIKKEILPKLKQNRNYLDKNNMELVQYGKVIDDPSKINWKKYKEEIPYDIRQRPGPGNSLGQVAFFFPNTYDIYLHDTPAKGLFSESSRAFSHGCIRLSHAQALAEYIFCTKDSHIDPDSIATMMNAPYNRTMRVNPNIPVYIVYFTTWVDQTGRANFRHDIYGHDARLAKEVFGK